MRGGATRNTKFLTGTSGFAPLMNPFSPGLAKMDLFAAGNCLVGTR